MGTDSFASGNTLTDSRRAGCFVGVWAIAKVETK
jgi:hypothetical protein